MKIRKKAFLILGLVLSVCLFISVTAAVLFDGAGGMMAFAGDGVFSNQTNTGNGTFGNGTAENGGFNNGGAQPINISNITENSTVVPEPADSQPAVKQKAASTFDAAGKTVKIKKSKLKKKSRTVKLASAMTISNARGALSFTLNSVSKAKYRKYFKINQATGNITVKKKLKKGTYKLTVTVTDPGNDDFEGASRIVTVKIKVK
jgi:hypothetical protein